MKVWNEFKNWVKYVREYKDNKDNDLIYDNNIIALQNEVDRLTKKLIEKEDLSKEKDNLLKLREERQQVISNNLSEAKIQIKTKSNIIDILNAQLDDAEETIKAKNLTIKELNMRYARNQKKIQKLEKDIQRKEHKIKFLLASKKAPSKEEILAYEMRMKEVEKRQKNGKSNNNI